ncbi:MAG: type I 3-dehydroquinate dehydratase [Candidatus Bathyarchaeota archaeon]|nr:MAG: type I 3-dehydroquinate dehydratase [Candidatus Bathyarchaeota archaeon]
MRRLLGKICGIVLSREEEGALQEIDIAVDQGADLVELRLDSILKADLSRLIQYQTIPKIVTDLAGIRSDEERTTNLKRAISLSPDYIDINFDFQLGENVRDELISLAKDQQIKVICSFHDYDRTPSESTMLSIISQMKAIGADIGKIAVEANSLNDCRTVLNLIHKSVEKEFPIIAFATGELGSFTRLVGPILGSFLTYAPISSEKIALGQIPLEKLVSIYKTLNLL